MPFRVRSSHSDVELVGNDVTDVVTAWITTSPSGVTLPVRVGDSEFNAAALSAWGNTYSDNIERWIAEPNVAGIYYEQDTNPSGNLTDTLVLILASDNGQITQELREPLVPLMLLGNIDAVIAPIIANLNAIQNLGG